MTALEIAARNYEVAKQEAQQAFQNYLASAPGAGMRAARITYEAKSMQVIEAAHEVGVAAGLR